jgi:hypothetical protein
VVLWQWRQLCWQRAVGLLVILAAAAGVWQMESAFHRQDYFVHARGENFLEMVKYPSQIKGLIGRDLPLRPIPAEQVNFCDKVEMGVALVRAVTLPQYAKLVMPDVHPQVHGAVVRYDPPPLPLYFAPLALFIVWGIALSLARLPSWPYACLLIWVAAGTVPLLLTNRVDSHRILLFVIPFSIWAALGVREAARVLRAAKVPQLVQHCVGALLLATVMCSDVNLLYDPSPPAPTAMETMFDEVGRIAGPVRIAWDSDHREVGLLQLHMLERMRRDPQWHGSFLPEGLRIHINTERNTFPPEVYVRDLHRMLDEATVLLAPAERFRGVAAALQRLGVRVAERGSSSFRVLRLDAGAQATGVPDEEVEPLPTIVIPPTPTPVPLRGGPQISLTDLEPVKTDFGFAPPRVNRAWNGPEISLGGVTYDRGIGTHAWTRMTYEVPANATEFQAVVGLADSRGDCPKASVTFEIWDQSGRRIYDSGLIDGASPPRALRVDVRGKRQITLVVTDAEDGIDCDHANWAVPVFLVGSP